MNVIAALKAAARRRPVELSVLPFVPALVAALLLALVLAATDRLIVRDLTEHALSGVQQSSRNFADDLERSISRHASELELLGRAAVFASDRPSHETLRAELQHLKDSSADYAWIGWIDATGHVVAATDGLLEGRLIDDRPVFTFGRQGLWFGSLHPPVALKPEMAKRGLPPPPELADLALPVHDAAGALRGVLAAHISGAALSLQLEFALGPSEGRHGIQMALMDGAGAVLLGSLPLERVLHVHSADADHDPPPALVTDSGGAVFAIGQHRLQAVDSGVQTNWMVLAAQPMSVALAPAAGLQRYVLVAGGLAALVLGGLGVWLSLRLSAPFARVFDAVAMQVGPSPAARPGVHLEAILEFLRAGPMAPLDSTQGGALLHQVLYDAEQIKLVLDELPTPVYFIDTEDRLNYWNASAAEIFGWHGRDLVGRVVTDVVEWVSPIAFKRSVMRQLRDESGPWTFELTVRRQDGQEVYGEWRVTRVADRAGRNLGLVCTVRDLTPEREARQSLLEQTETLAAIIQSSSDAVISTSEDGIIELFNPAAERIFRCSARNLIGQPLDSLIPSVHREAHRAHLARFADSSVTRRRMGSGRVTGRRSDGAELELDASVSQVTVRGRRVLTAILRDVTERVKAERRQLEYQHELSDLSRRLMDQEQNTTRRLAQILHDRLGQTLTALRLSVDALGSLQGGGLTEPLRERMDKIDALTQQAVVEVRQALTELRPPLLEESGLASALDNECRMRLSEAAPTVCELLVEPDAERLRWPPDVEYAAFMVAREAMLNAIRHAHARRIDVVIGGDAQHLLVDVVDDGVGLPPEMERGRAGHLGIVGMRERAIAIGAQLSVLAPSGGGTLVRLEWEAGE